MRMHGKQRTKQEGLPGKLRGMIQPTAEHEYEQVTGLNQNVERRSALPSEARSIVQPDGLQQRGIPPQDARSQERKERNQKWDLHHGDLPFQCAELFAFAARTEHESAFAWIHQIGFGVDDVIDAIKEEPEREQHKE